MTKNEQKKLDRLFQEIIVRNAKNKCFINPEHKAFMAHHIFSRNSKSTRWNTENGICVCQDCHNKIHSGNIDLKQILINQRGEDWYRNLQLKSSSVVKYQNYESLKESLITDKNYASVV